VKRWLRSILTALLRKLYPKPIPIDHARENALLKRILEDQLREQSDLQFKRDSMERIAELQEARQMAGAGPWRVDEAVLEETDRVLGYAMERLNQGPPRSGSIAIRETAPITAQGATGDIELALQNVEWRREINLSWLEFSRWGIQQMILISRLAYIKHPLIQRGINITATYVFGRGVEVISEDAKANEVLKAFFERNKAILGQRALTNLQKRIQYDGQIFYIFFADTVNKGETIIRTIDATEIFEIVTNPGDTDEHWLYLRKWTEKIVDFTNQRGQANTREEYYPALNWEPTVAQKAQPKFQGKTINWDNPVLMQKGGCGVAKWHFDTPKTYAALDWARNSRRLLEADLNTRMALSQIAMKLTTKGGQQALEGAKAALSTTVGPTSNLWDANPPAVSGSTFASGTGTTLEAFDTRGAIRNPSDVREYRAMVAIVFEIPPTFLGDLETANLATATTLDRPTELAMIEKQEGWRETLVTIAMHVLKVNQGAPSGRLSEAGREKPRRVVECGRRRLKNGSWIYEASQSRPDDEIQLKCNFPAIREGDMPLLIKAVAEAMTLDNKGGQVVGIDERVGVGLLYEQLGVADYHDVLELQYPETGKDAYDPSRIKEPLPPPIPTAPPISPGGQPQAPGGSPIAPPVKAAERLLAALESLRAKHSRG
jgi:hypothetical protein